MPDSLISTVGLLLCLAPAGDELGAAALRARLVNANHAGIPALGRHPRISTNGRHVGIVFAPFWAAVSVLNGLAFAASTA